MGSTVMTVCPFGSCHFLQPLGCLDTAPVQPHAVGRAQVFDIPPAAGNPEARVVAGVEFVVDNQLPSRPMVNEASKLRLRSAILMSKDGAASPWRG